MSPVAAPEAHTVTERPSLDDLAAAGPGLLLEELERALPGGTARVPVAGFQSSI
jgi:hypothetical protein